MKCSNLGSFDFNIVRYFININYIFFSHSPANKTRDIIVNLKKWFISHNNV